ncbi:MAG: putative sugar kinase YdjH [Candidatus Thorarchaeota archaeon]|nr:MAG: putative sugar kinase YdjH [Candidatus Thorarchaeota archaeon]
MNLPLYDIVSIGNPLYNQISNTQTDIKKSELAGGSLTVCLTADTLGISRLVMISSVEESERNDIFSLIENTQIEYFFLDPETEIKKQDIIKEGHCEGKIVGNRGRIRIRDIPEEFLLTKTMVLSPVLQEVDVDLTEWISSSTDAFVLLDLQGFLRKHSHRGYSDVTWEPSDARRLLNSTDLVKANTVEASLFTGEKDPFVAAETLVEWGAEISLITLGSDGCIIYDGNEFLEIPAFSTEVVCSLCAGDVFLGSFSTHLLETDNLLSCGLFATSVTSIILEKEESFPLAIKQSEIQRRVDMLQDQVKIL